MRLNILLETLLSLIKTLFSLHVRVHASARKCVCVCVHACMQVPASVNKVTYIIIIISGMYGCIIFKVVV